MGHEAGGNTRSGPGPSIAPVDSLVYNDLMGTIEEGGIFWPDLTQAADATDELVFPCSLTLRFLTTVQRSGAGITRSTIIS